MNNIDELIDRFLCAGVSDAGLSDAEASELEKWMKVQANLERFARRATLHADLRRALRRRTIQSTAIDICGGNEFAVAITPDQVRPEPAGNRRFTKTLVIALAVAACFLIALIRWSGWQAGKSTEKLVATVVNDVDALLIRGNQTWDASRLAAGGYELRRGLLHLGFSGSVMAYVEAPASFEVINGESLMVHNGRVSANVPPEGIGFTIDTPEAKVTDFGTEFSVDVVDGESEVHVFDGRVRVQPRSSMQGPPPDAVDLRTAEAVKINKQSNKPVQIDLAKDRFIRTFDEPKRRYPSAVKRMSPLAYYRMPIRDRGLLSDPPEFSGVVLQGTGRRPPHASGISKGGSLRVLAESSGRGGRVDESPDLPTGKFSLSVFVKLESENAGSGAVARTIATNFNGSRGNFALGLNLDGVIEVTVRQDDGEMLRVASEKVLPSQIWRHIIVTADTHQLKIFEDGVCMASSPCKQLAISRSDTLWFGTSGQRKSDADANLWNGRIDELALFDKGLGQSEVEALHFAANDEMAITE